MFSLHPIPSVVFLIIHVNSFRVHPSTVSSPEMPKWSQQTIYGVDDRKEVYEVSADIQHFAKSSAALFYKQAFTDEGDHYVLDDFYRETYGEDENICEYEAFYGQPAPSWCTGFLVGPDVLVTAGHCMRDVDRSSPADCSTTAFLFDYQMPGTAAEKGSVEWDNIPKHRVYFCKEIVDGQSTGTADWVVLLLDREVTGGRPYLTVREEPAEVGDKGFIISNPYGLPTKVSTDVQVYKRVRNVYTVTADIMAGSSGAMFIDLEGKVIGLVQSGLRDFGRDRENGNCKNSWVVKEPINANRKGEQMTRSSLFISAVAEALERPPSPSTPYCPSHGRTTCETLTTSTEGEITPPTDSNGKYETDVDQMWIYEGGSSDEQQEGQTCVTTFVFHKFNSQQCQDYVTIQGLDDTSPTKLCGRQKQTHIEYFQGTGWRLHWVSNNRNTRKAWRVNWNVQCVPTECTATTCKILTGSSGNLKPPMSPDGTTYLGAQYIQWIRAATSGEENQQCSTTFHFKRFRVEESMECTWDFLLIEDLTTNTPTSIHQKLTHARKFLPLGSSVGGSHDAIGTPLCGAKKKFTLSVDTSNWIIFWHTDHSEEDKGFNLDWTVNCDQRQQQQEGEANSKFIAESIKRSTSSSSVDTVVTVHPCKHDIDCSDISGDKGLISAPTTSDGYYKNNIRKRWIHPSNPGSVQGGAKEGSCSTWFQFHYFSVEELYPHHGDDRSNKNNPVSSPWCEFDWLRIQHLPTKKWSKKFCGTLLQPWSIELPDSTAFMVEWNTDESVNRVGGFTLEWTTVCNQDQDSPPQTTSNTAPTTYLSEGPLRYPYPPQRTYTQNDSQMWIINPQQQQQTLMCDVSINLHAVILEPVFDRLFIIQRPVTQQQGSTVQQQRVQEGDILLWSNSEYVHQNETVYISHQKGSSTTTTSTTSTTINTPTTTPYLILVMFISDQSINKWGFHLTYTKVCPTQQRDVCGTNRQKCTVGQWSDQQVSKSTPLMLSKDTNQLVILKDSAPSPRTVGSTTNNILWITATTTTHAKNTPQSQLLVNIGNNNLAPLHQQQQPDQHVFVAGSSAVALMYNGNESTTVQYQSVDVTTVVRQPANVVAEDLRQQCSSKIAGCSYHHMHNVTKFVLNIEGSKKSNRFPARNTDWVLIEGLPTTHGRATLQAEVEGLHLRTQRGRCIDAVNMYSFVDGSFQKLYNSCEKQQKPLSYEFGEVLPDLVLFEVLSSSRDGSTVVLSWGPKNLL